LIDHPNCIHALFCILQQYQIGRTPQIGRLSIVKINEIVNIRGALPLKERLKVNGNQGD
jgi:hypothetical protein